MSETSPQPRKGIMDIAAYVPGRETAPGVAKVHKLSSNETPLGASPAVAEAIARVAGRLERYPDGSAHELRQAIAQTVDVPESLDELLVPLLVGRRQSPPFDGSQQLDLIQHV